MLRVRRRDFLKSLPALAAAPRLLAQAPGSPLIPVRALNHMTLSVSDPKRSIDFYQGLFGMPIQARQGPTTLLRIGAGPQFLALSGAGASGTPELYFGDPDGIVVQLQDTTYCGGSGVLGSSCGAPEAAPKKGLLAVRDLSHFTISATDAARSNKFYQDLFGL